MSNVQIQQALAQMRVMAAEARGHEPAQGVAGAERPEFAQMLRQAVDGVNGLQQDATSRVDGFLKGDDISLVEVMTATQKSRVAFEATKQVRNSLLEAYREISRMQV